MKTGPIKYFRLQVLFLAIMGLIYIVGLFILCLYVGEPSFWWVLLPGIIVGIMLVIVPVVLQPRLHMRVLVSERDITSYSFFKRQFCRVELDKPVYYAKCYLRIGAGLEYMMLAVSNSPFECSPLEAKPIMNRYDKRLTFQSCYDRSKIVVLPYDEESKPWLPLEQWTSTYGIVP